MAKQVFSIRLEPAIVERIKSASTPTSYGEGQSSLVRQIIEDWFQSRLTAELTEKKTA